MIKLRVLALLALPGCTNMMDFKPTMASDPPQVGIEGIALVNELSNAYSRTAPADSLCHDTKLGSQDSRKEAVYRYRKGTKNADDIFRCTFFKSLDQETPARRVEIVQGHVKAGFALSDYYCDNFFTRIAEHAGKRKFARNSTNDVGALVSTVLGLAAAGSGITGGVGAGFGLADSVWRNYDENFLVSADLPTLQRLVQSEQDKYRETVYKAIPDNYPDATIAILRYANLCSFVGMRGLLTQSMADKTDNNNVPNAADENRVTKGLEDALAAYKRAKEAKSGKAPAGAVAPAVTPTPAPEDTPAQPDTPSSPT
jgi:hypothetical protein